MMRHALVLCLLGTVVACAQSAKPSAPARQYRIAGVVYDATSGQTLPGARISLGVATAKDVPDRTVLTGPDGSFAFEHLAAGKYQMFGEAVGFQQQGFEQHEAPYLTGIVVGPDAPADKLVFRMQRSCGISGTVTDEFNDPVREARVMVFRKGLQNGRFNTQPYRMAQTDDRGFYKAAPLLPGTYIIAVTARPWYARSASEYGPGQVVQASENRKQLDVAFPLTFYSGATEASDASEIVLRNGERTTADVVLHSVPALQVRVMLSQRQKPRQPQDPVPFVRLTQTIFGAEDETLGVGLNLRQVMGQEYATLEGVAPGHYLAHLSTPGQDGERTREMDITTETTIDPETFVSSATTSVHGLVQMSGGAAAPPGLVVLLEGHNGNTLGSQVGPKGEISFEHVPPGTYEVSVTNARDFFILDKAATNAKINGRSLTITGGSPVSVAIVLGKGTGEIHGFAMREGKGLGGTMVLLVPHNPGSNNVLFRRDQSDSDGSFALTRIVPGKYRVIAIEEGWDLEWSKPEVLKPYLEKSEEMEITAGGKYEMKVEVQTRAK